MRIVITGDANPMVLENVEAVMLSAATGEDAAVNYARGEAITLGSLAISILVGVRRKLGEVAFEQIVAIARHDTQEGRDLSAVARGDGT